MSPKATRFEEDSERDLNVTGAHVRSAASKSRRARSSSEVSVLDQDESTEELSPELETTTVKPSETSAGKVGRIRGRSNRARKSSFSDPSKTGANFSSVNTQASASTIGAKPAIVFENVCKFYDAQPDRPALNDISLKVYPGEFVFLVGHSGSGKSTFIRLINREIQLTSGNLYVAGENLANMKTWRIPFLRRNIGCVFQDFKLLPKKTAFENIAFALEVTGKSKHIINTQVPEVLRLVGLEGKIDKYPDQLSGGEQQRVSIARAIVNRPPLLICDEPTGNLDPQTSLGIMRLLDRINRTGTIVMVATHDKEMVNSMRRRVVALESGNIIRDQDRGVYGLDA